MDGKKNLQLWDAVQSTDPTFTKEYSGPGGFKGTAINATWLVRKATEVWGPIGCKWGYEIVEDRFDQGGPIQISDDGTVVFASVHTLKLKLWYMVDGKQCQIEHYGHTPYIYKNKYGVQTDFEAPKKSLTDALKKCMSLLGFGADIHLGMYEDQEYKLEIETETKLQKAEDKADEARRQSQDYAEFLKKHIHFIETSTTMGELEKIFVAATRRAQAKKDDKGLVAITRAKDARKTELMKQEEAA